MSAGQRTNQGPICKPVTFLNLIVLTERQGCHCFIRPTKGSWEMTGHSQITVQCDCFQTEPLQSCVKLITWSLPVFYILVAWCTCGKVITKVWKICVQECVHCSWLRCSIFLWWFEFHSTHIWTNMATEMISFSHSWSFYYKVLFKPVWRWFTSVLHRSVFCAYTWLLMRRSAVMRVEVHGPGRAAGSSRTTVFVTSAICMDDSSRQGSSKTTRLRHDRNKKRSSRNKRIQLIRRITLVCLLHSVLCLSNNRKQNYPHSSARWIFPEGWYICDFVHSKQDSVHWLTTMAFGELNEATPTELSAEPIWRPGWYRMKLWREINVTVCVQVCWNLVAPRTWVDTSPRQALSAVASTAWRFYPLKEPNESSALHHRRARTMQIIRFDGPKTDSICPNNVEPPNSLSFHGAGLS